MDAIKIGVLGTAEAVRAVAAGLPARRAPPVVLDPVLATSSGAALLDEAGKRALLELLPQIALLTPNVPEAAALLGEPEGRSTEALIGQAHRLRALGTAAVLLKVGHASGEEAVDHLVDVEGARSLTGRRLPGTRRGTGCQLASGVAAGLAGGLSLLQACERARAHVRQRLEAPAE